MHEALSHANDDSSVIAAELSEVPSLLIKSGTLQKFIRGLFRLCELFSRLKAAFTKWRQSGADTDALTFCAKLERHFQEHFLDVRVHCRRFCMSRFFFICLMDHSHKSHVRKWRAKGKPQPSVLILISGNWRCCFRWPVYLTEAFELCHRLILRIFHS